MMGTLLMVMGKIIKKIKLLDVQALVLWRLIGHAQEGLIQPLIYAQRIAEMAIRSLLAQLDVMMVTCTMVMGKT
jgi:hypothetical protein